MGASRSRLDAKRSHIQRQRWNSIESLIDEEKIYSHEARSEESSRQTGTKVKPENYEFPFENLVLEGGGSKGLAYCGAVQYLEEIGVMPNIKRFAGTSAGAIMATLLAVGYSSSDVKQLMGQNLEKVFLDGNYFHYVRNLFWNFGIHPGYRVYNWLGERLKYQTGSADVTFEQIKKKYGRELCVVVTNLNMMRTEYCHPKTTPDMPVRLALRMSMSIPGLFTAQKYRLNGSKDVFVDGGILCNYPIHCFDGWYLSMAKEDNFIKRLQPCENLPLLEESRFKSEKINLKTLGLQLYAECERDFLRNAIENRFGTEVQPVKPDKETKLYKKWFQKQEDLQKMEQVHQRLSEAMNSFLEALEKHTKDGDAFNRQQIEDAFKDDVFTTKQAELLFGKDVNAQKVFECLDLNKDGRVHYSELLTFVGELGVHLQNRPFDYRRRSIENLTGFAKCIGSTLLVNSKKTSVKPTDVQRTVGINTGHVVTTDFKMEEADKKFLIDRGYNACKVFLQQFVEDNKLQPKETERSKVDRDRGGA